MPYQYVREPLTADEADQLAAACEAPTGQLIDWTFSTPASAAAICAR